MDSLYLLIPLSVLAALGIAALLVWAVFSGQFERLDDVGTQVLREEPEREEGSGGPPPTAR
jgi:cbb3-type cytochrome oxidase maturation protein